MPNTCSTPSALRHSMMASTARMTARAPFGEGKNRPGGPGKASVTAGFSGLRRSDRGLSREVQVGPAAHADLVRDRYEVPAFGAGSAWLHALSAVQERGEYPDAGERDPDQEPDEEGAPLELADRPAGDAEHEGDEDELHR